MPEYARGTPLVLSNGAATPLERVDAPSERWLQELIHDNPACLPMDQIEPGIGGLTAVCMELPVDVGSIDNLLVTPDGYPVVVEVKLKSNQEMRRRVVAQALEYATAMFRLDYQGLERAVSRGDFGARARPVNLYDLVAGPDAPPKADFVARVGRNLREGRVVVLIVGDAIPPQTDDLVSGLKQHANFSFTFALVELDVYAPAPTGSSEIGLVVPNTLVKTLRYAIRKEGSGPVVTDVTAARAARGGRSSQSSFSSEDFFAVMAARRPDIPDKLTKLVDDVAAINVQAEIGRTLKLKWDPPDGKTVTLGYIMQSDGTLWTEEVARAVDRHLARRYISDLAKAFRGEVKDGKVGARVVKRGGDAFTVEEIVDRLPAWPGVIEKLQEAVRAQTREAD